MSTKIMFKMTIDEAKEELVANERMQEAIAEKFNWPELTDKEYIAAELRLSECQAEEEVLRSTIDFWEQFQKGLDKKVEKSLDKKLDEHIKSACPPKDFVPIDFTKDSEYIRLFGIESHQLGIEAFE
mgnify:CR=1 FL=1